MKINYSHHLLISLEINECDSSPCQNGATCSNLIGQFVCKCLPGYDGVFCENGKRKVTLRPLIGNSFEGNTRKR